MKKSKVLFTIFIVLLICCLSFVLVACGGNNNDDKDNGSENDGNGGNIVAEILEYVEVDGGYSVSLKLDAEKENITEVVIPETYNEKPVVSIKSEAFFECTKLTSVTLPKNLINIGNSAFFGCTSLEKVNIKDLSAYCTINFENQDASPIATAKNLYLNGELVTDLVIPNDIATINNYAFNNCTSITSITIPNTVITIGKSTFSNCSNISTATMPTTAISSIPHINLKTLVINGGDSIDKYALMKCSTLTSITISNSVKTIGESAFSECSSLTSVIIPDSVTKIESHAFENCINLESVILSENMTNIGWQMFNGCKKLKTLKLGNKIKGIGVSAFEDCTSLETITYAGAKAEWIAITKESNWNKNSSEFIVICTDGKLDKNNNEIE